MWVLMVVPSNFPNNDAGAIRDDAFAQIYRELGYDVKLIGRGTFAINGTYHGVDFVSINGWTGGISGKIYRLVIEPKKYKKQIDKWISEYGMPSIIHINHIHERTINYLIDIAKDNNIQIVHDSVEWYSACEFALGKFSKEYIWKDRLNRKVIRKPVKVYAISSYLNKHFISRGLESCRIPVIMDIKKSEGEMKSSRKKDSDKISFIYAGNPGKKDCLGEIINAFGMLNEDEKRCVELNVFGISEKHAKMLAQVDVLSSCINVHGKVQREIIIEALKEADFSVLSRPKCERYAKAGFPTKSVEAMSHGVAMMCNISSDLETYLKHGYNAIVCSEHTAASLCDGIRQVLKLDRKSIDDIKINARKTAEIFDYRNYIGVVKKFLSK